MPKKILIIDDDPGFIDPIKDHLLSLGFHVLTAFDGITGYELAKQTFPDLITLGITVPFLNGYSVCGFLKSHEVYKSIPIIMITPEALDRDKDFSEDIKPDVIFPKTCNINQFMHAVKELLNFQSS